MADSTSNEHIQISEMQSKGCHMKICKRHQKFFRNFCTDHCYYSHKRTTNSTSNDIDRRYTYTGTTVPELYYDTVNHHKKKQPRQKHKSFMKFSNLEVCYFLWLYISLCFMRADCLPIR